MGRLALVFVAGCFSPHPQPGAPCVDGICPEGLTCSPASQTCELRAVDAGQPPHDASPDGGLPDAAPGGPMLVQQITNYIATGPTLSATLQTAPASGHVLVMIGADPQGALTSVTGGGVTWTLATRSLANANIEIWFGTTDGSSSTVTITLTSSAAPMWMSVSEWAGLAATTTLDIATSTSGSASSASAGSITTTGPALVLFGVADGSPNTFGTPTPGAWTAMTGINGADTQLEWYLVATAAGTFGPSVSVTATTWDAAIAAFRMP